MKKQKRIWFICQLGVVVLSILTFTPLVIPYKRHLPELFGLPYTLWVGMLISLCFIVLILLGVRVHPIAMKKKDDL
jgi:hypothetical protein